MKKLLFVMVLVMAAVVVNAQRTTVAVADLQKSITDYITKDYVGFTIKAATKVVVNNMTSFEVVITKGTTQETLVFDSTGKFLKKTGLKTGTVQKKPAKTTTRPAVKN